MIASAAGASTSLTRRIAQRAAEFKDNIGLNLGNFIAASSALFVSGYLSYLSARVTFDTAVAADPTAGYSNDGLSFFGSKLDIWLTAALGVTACTVMITYCTHWVVEKTLLRKERSKMDTLALTLTSFMAAALCTAAITANLENIARGLAWVIYEFQLHIVGFNPEITSVPDNVA